jgi:hypothetical protein
MSTDIQITDANNLYIVDGDLVIASESTEVKQALKMRLLSWQGEWIQDVASGLPWLDKILAHNVSQDVKDRLIKKEILGTKHVTRLLRYEFGINRTTGTIYIDFAVDTEFGPTVVQVIT